jgi:hypoxanthine phosphoribosyltransferase
MKKIQNIYYLVLIIYLTLIISQVINPTLKYLMNELWGYSFCKRPLYSCHDSEPVLRCLGFPSGHAQTVTVIALTIFALKLISFPVAIIIIFVVSLQRIVYNMHTVGQVIAGIVTGLIYFSIYRSYHFNPIVFLLPLLNWVIILIILLLIVERKLAEPIPEWVDSSMLSIIEKKKDVMLLSKFVHIATAPFLRSQLYMSWYQLEKHMDKLIDKVSNRNFDCIIGIKSGGAIMAPYFAKKMNLPYFTIKLSDKKYNCNKSSSDMLNMIISRKLDDKYKVCEDITESISGKRVLLVDEIINTGKTTIETINYLMNEKKTQSVYPVCVTVLKKNLKYTFDYEYTMNNIVQVWPWGYEN